MTCSASWVAYFYEYRLMSVTVLQIYNVNGACAPLGSIISHGKIGKQGDLVPAHTQQVLV